MWTMKRMGTKTRVTQPCSVTLIVASAAKMAEFLYQRLRAGPGNLNWGTVWGIAHTFDK